jgi:hypothetical protein
MRAKVHTAGPVMQDQPKNDRAVLADAWEIGFGGRGERRRMFTKLAS